MKTIAAFSVIFALGCSPSGAPVIEEAAAEAHELCEKIEVQVMRIEAKVDEILVRLDQ